MTTAVDDDIQTLFDKTLTGVPDDLRGVDLIQYLVNGRLRR